MDMRLLIVDDDISICTGFKELLSDEGFWVEGALTGREALSKIKERYFHIVLMDVVLKETTGIEMIKKIKKVSQETVVIMITAYPTVEAAVQSFKAGAQDFLIKPIRKKSLLVSLQKGVKRKKVEKEINTLKRIKDMTEKSNLEKNFFLQQVSENIRFVMGRNIKLAEKMLQTRIDETQAHYLSSMRAESFQLFNLAENILDIAKVETGQLDLEQKGFCLEETVKDVARIIYPSIGEKPVQFFYEIDKNIPKVLNGDPNRVKQILINLVANAVEVSSEGEISLKVRLMTILGDGCHVFFVVKDCGPEILKKKQLNIFKPFSDEKRVLKGYFGWRGLNLWMCKTLVEKMGGLISLHSETNKGNEFRFSIRFNCSRKKA